MPNQQQPAEYLKQTTRSKKTFFYRNEEGDIDVKSRDVFLSGQKEIHYPFDRTGSQKYKYIRSIEFRNVKPTDVKGVYKSPNFGLGFTKNLSPIIYELEKYSSVKRVVISPTLATQIKNGAIIFNKKDLENIFNSVKGLKENQSTELKRISNNQLAKYISNKFTFSGKIYKKNELSQFIDDKKISSVDLSENDIYSLVALIPEKIEEKKIIYNAEEKINFIKLNKTKEELQKLIGQKSATSKYEEKCQKFLTENSWIFSNVLAMPIAIMGAKTYVGGKSYANTGGKEADFLYKNNLTKNVCIFEIKTPLKKIFDTNTPYRKPDIYHLGRELTGGVIQLLDQKDNLQKDFYTISKGNFESFNPKCILLIGKISDLTEDQVKCFELYRNNLTNVEIITFDELASRTELILGQFIEKK